MIPISLKKLLNILSKGVTYFKIFLENNVLYHRCETINVQLGGSRKIVHSNTLNFTSFYFLHTIEWSIWSLSSD